MTEIKEEWRDIKGYEGLYQVSNIGRIKSFKRNEKILSSHISTNGYYNIRLAKDSKRTSFMVHRLVADSFVKNPNNKPCVNHIDGNKLNILAGNLEWCTSKENIHHSFNNQLNKFGEKHGCSKLLEQDVIKIMGLFKEGLSGDKIASIFNVSRSAIYHIKAGNSWSQLTGVVSLKRADKVTNLTK